MRKTEKIEEIWDEDRQRLYERKPPPREITRKEKLKKLWVDYLRISPSYELARQIIKDGLDPNAAKEPIDSFELVLKTFDDFKDVWRVRPSIVYDWTEKNLFKATLFDPKVREIASIPAMESGNHEQINDTLIEYLDKLRPNSGMHGSLILAIPPQLSKRDLLVQISNLLNDFNRINNKNDENMSKPRAKYECQVSKLREAAIRQSFEAVMVRAQNPDWPIWKIGVELNLHPTAAQEITKAESLHDTIPANRKRLDKDDNAAGAKVLMNSLVSRCFKRAFLIAENAAKGKFPCVDPILDAKGNKIEAHFDYVVINKKLKAYREKYPDILYPEDSF
jgi:hypothetical protein